MIYYFGNIVNMKEIGGDIMSFLFEELTREECEDIREKDGYYKAKKEDASKMKNMNIPIEQIIEVFSYNILR